MRTSVGLLLLVGLGCSCSRPPGPVGPQPGSGDAGAAEDGAPVDAGVPVEAAVPPADAGAAEEVEPLPPELAGDEQHPVRIFFESDKPEIPEIAHALLGAVVERLRLRPGEVVRLVGHADSRERPGGALELSRKRAEAVRRWLEEAGVDTNRFFIDARGDFEPAGDEATDQGRAANRRVDFVFQRGFVP